MISVLWFHVAVFTHELANRLRGFSPPSCALEIIFHMLDTETTWVVSFFIPDDHKHAFSHMAMESRRGLNSCPLQQSSCSVMAAMFWKAPAEKWTCCLILLFLSGIVRSGWLRSLLSKSEENVCVCVGRILPDNRHVHIWNRMTHFL